MYVTLCLSCAVLHVMWYLWIVAGSGNANFFYFQTIVLNFASSFIIVEAITAVRKLYYAVQQQTKHKTE